LAVLSSVESAQAAEQADQRMLFSVRQYTRPAMAPGSRFRFFGVSYQLLVYGRLGAAAMKSLLVQS
jgi:hypothetical protein